MALFYFQDSVNELVLGISVRPRMELAMKLDIDFTTQTFPVVIKAAYINIFSVCKSLFLI